MTKPSAATKTLLATVLALTMLPSVSAVRLNDLPPLPPLPPIPDDILATTCPEPQHTPIGAVYSNTGFTFEWALITILRDPTIVLEDESGNDFFEGAWQGEQIDYYSDDGMGSCEITYTWRKIQGYFTVTMSGGGSTGLGSGHYECEFTLITVVRDGDTEPRIVKDQGKGFGTYSFDGIINFSGTAYSCGLLVGDWNNPASVEAAWVADATGPVDDAGSVICCVQNNSEGPNSASDLAEYKLVFNGVY